MFAFLNTNAQSPIIKTFREIVADAANDFNNYKVTKISENKEKNYDLYSSKIEELPFSSTKIIVPTNNKKPIYFIKYSIKDLDVMTLKLFTNISEQYITEINEMIKTGKYTGKDVKEKEDDITELYDLKGAHIMDYISNVNAHYIYIYGTPIAPMAAPKVEETPKADDLETIFKKDLEVIFQDATTGFRESKAGYNNKSYGSTYYFAEKSFFNLNNTAQIGYTAPDYLPASKLYIDEAFFFYQNFSNETNYGKFVYDNAERIFDEIMSLKNLKKKIIKQDKSHKEINKEVVYLDNNKAKKLFIFYNLKDKSSSIYIYSDLRPTDLPKYFGCLVLYNVQMGSIVSANTYYVYGKAFKGEAYLYNIIRSKMDETSQRIFKKYEWKPNAGTKQIDELMKSLNIRENGSKVDPDGNYIN